MRIKMINLIQSITIVDLQLVEQSQVNMPEASTAPHPFLFETIAQHLDDDLPPWELECPPDGDAFTFDPKNLDGWSMLPALLTKLPSNLQKSVKSMQLAGAATVTGIDRLRGMGLVIDDEPFLMSPPFRNHHASETHSNDTVDSNAVHNLTGTFSALLPTVYTDLSPRRESETSNFSALSLGSTGSSTAAMSPLSPLAPIDPFTLKPNPTGSRMPSPFPSPAIREDFTSPFCTSPPSPYYQGLPPMSPPSYGSSAPTSVLPPMVSGFQHQYQYSLSPMPLTPSSLSRRTSGYTTPITTSSLSLSVSFAQGETHPPREQADSRRLAELSHLRSHALVRLRHSIRRCETDFTEWKRGNDDGGVRRCRRPRSSGGGGVRPSPPPPPPLLPPQYQGRKGSDNALTSSDDSDEHEGETGDETDDDDVVYDEFDAWLTAKKEMARGLE
ncbi:hypothetical protein LTS18_007092, partial [Coniosporium uncinatum]